MANMLIKGIPDALYKQLKKKAQEDFRSLTQEVIWVLSRGIADETYSEEELQKLEKLAERSNGGKVVKTMDELKSFLASMKK